MNFTSKISVLKSTKWQLFWVSFIILYMEIMALRWMGMEFPTVRIFPNLIMMVILIAMSAGLTSSKSSLANAKILRSPLPFLLCGAFVLITLIAAPQLQIFKQSINTNQELSVVVLSIAFFMLVVVSLYVVFLRLGSLLAPLLDKLPSLTAYGINLLGSICGVVSFGLISYLSAPPFIWIAVIGIVAYLIRQEKIYILCAALFAILAFSLNHQSYWSPYSKLDIIPLESSSSNNPLVKDGYILNSNNAYFHTGVHILVGENTKEFLTAKTNVDPIWRKIIGTYFQFMDIPFLCAPSCDNTLILGSGSGNDVACALVNNVKHVDAVEIDPITCGLGKTRHPDHPYLDKRVSLYNEDARTFLRYTKEKYDLVEFAFLDPGETIRASSFLRVDNYVYTTESIKSVLKCLNPNGLGVILFAPDVEGMITARLYNTIKEASGNEPLTYQNKKLGLVMLFFGPGTSKVVRVVNQNPELEQWTMPAALKDTKTCTDQWPFLYTSNNYKGMFLYFGILLAVVVLPGLWIFLGQRKNAHTADMGNMFFLGLAFMLVETKSVVELSLLFGSTWIVSSTVITAILVLAFTSNLIVQKTEEGIPLIYLYLLLVAALSVQYFFSVPSQTDWPPIVVAVIATLIACLPILFSSMIFSYCFRQSDQPSAFLSANFLGVSVGGLTENFSLLLGTKGLIMIALLIYGLSALCLANSNSRLLFKKVAV